MENSYYGCSLPEACSLWEFMKMKYNRVFKALAINNQNKE